MASVDNVTGPLCEHGEGPVWSDSWSGLRWVDASRGHILTLLPDGVTRLSLDDTYAAFVRPRRGGGYVVAGSRRLWFSPEAHSLPGSSLELIDHDRARLNEGGTDRDGRLFAGSTDLPGHHNQGVVFLIDPTSGKPVVTTAFDDVQASNGIDFSPDGTKAYYVDSLTRRIDVFDYSMGTLTHRRPFVSFETDDGLPDGLTVAADGSVWVAMWGGFCVKGYDSTGTLQHVIDVPVPQVTACTFGGDDLSSLFITTSRWGLSVEPGAPDGSLYVGHPGVRGIPVVKFAG